MNESINSTPPGVAPVAETITIAPGESVKIEALSQEGVDGDDSAPVKKDTVH